MSHGFFARKLLRPSLKVRIYTLPNKQVFYDEQQSKTFQKIKGKLSNIRDRTQEKKEILSGN